MEREGGVVKGMWLAGMVGGGCKNDLKVFVHKVGTDS